MSYIMGDRYQMTFLPPCIEDYISDDDPVRAYDAFVEALDFTTLGIAIDENNAGANPYWPKAMLKLLTYGYSYGIRSSRKLERATQHNLSFIWLTGNLQPDFRTIARFRKDNKKALKEVLRQCVHMCMKLDLIEGNTLFIDSSKIKANASLKNTWTEEKCKEHLEKISKNIDKILEECERIDQQEEDKGSLVKLKEELRNKETLVAEIKDIVRELERTNKTQLNTTDPDCVKTKGGQRTNTYHSAQITVDERHGLIVTTEAVGQVNDSNQFSRQIMQAKETLCKVPENSCSDSGYFDVEDLKEVTEDTNVIVPTQQQVQRENKVHTVRPFHKAEFTYDRKRDEYICPEGNRLQRINKKPFGRATSYSYRAHGAESRQCQHFKTCTSSSQGRIIIRHKDEHIKEQLEEIYHSPKGQQIYKLRKEKVELPFAHIKHNLGVRHFLLRRSSGATAELSLCAVGYNITRMITLLGGMPRLIQGIQAI